MATAAGIKGTKNDTTMDNRRVRHTIGIHVFFLPATATSPIYGKWPAAWRPLPQSSQALNQFLSS